MSCLLLPFCGGPWNSNVGETDNATVYIRWAYCLLRAKRWSIWRKSHTIKPHTTIKVFCGEGARSRRYGRTATLRLLVQPYDEDYYYYYYYYYYYCPFPGNGAPMEWNWQVKTEILGENLSQCHFVHQKSHCTYPGSNPGLQAGRPAANRLSRDTTLNHKLHQREHCLRIFICYFISL
jgi:hypothetical protein